MLVLEGCFVLALDIVFASFDLFDNSSVIGTGNRIFQIHEGPMRGGQKAAVVLRITAEAPYFGLENRGDLAAPLGQTL